MQGGTVLEILPGRLGKTGKRLLPASGHQPQHKPDVRMRLGRLRQTVEPVGKLIRCIEFPQAASQCRLRFDRLRS